MQEHYYSRITLNPSMHLSRFMLLYPKRLLLIQATVIGAPHLALYWARRLLKGRFDA